MARLLPLISAPALRRPPSDEFERLWIWRESDLGDRLAWYRRVASNRMPAKFRIAARIPIENSLESASEEELWATLDARTPAFLDLWEGIRRGVAELPDPRPRPSLLDLCRELTQRMLRHCTFCRWHCRVDRSRGTKLGTCKLAGESRVSSYFHHPGEELIYRGRRGSGTIFFTSCNMRCSFCLHPDTFVLTQRGPERIARLYAEAGPEIARDGGRMRLPEKLSVLSHDGRWVKASRIFRHEYTGELVCIEPLYGPRLITTPDHEILATTDSGEVLAKTPASELVPGSWLAIPRPGNPDGETDALDVAATISALAAESRYTTRTQHRLPAMEQAVALAQAGATSVQIAARLGYHPTYARALVNKVRRAGFPHAQRPNGLVIEGGRVRLKTGRRPGIPTTLEIGEELAEFLGYYCAEGHVTKGVGRPSSYRVVLSFGRHEQELVDRVAALIRQLFDLEPRIVERRTTITVEVAKSSFALLLRALCGGTAATKRVPAFLFQAPRPVVEAFLGAFVVGDGCTTNGYLSLNTVSEALAMGLFGLYLRLGHLPSFNVYDPPREKVIEGRRVSQSRLYYVKVRLRRMQEDSWQTAKHVRYRFGDDSILVPIHRIRRIPYSGPVYNLEVDDPDHTYAANFVAVGNCQNGDISTDKDNGQVVSPRALATMAWLLRMEGCHNVNWVGGEVTIHLHTIVEAISLLEDLDPTEDDLLGALGPKADGLFGHALDAERATFRGGFNAPLLWNSNFFMSEDSLKILRLLMDVWLPDLKFGPGKCAVALSRTPWYWETVTGNIQQIHAWGEELTIRHLVMPNHVDCCTRSVLEWVAATVPDVPVNVMDQFHPDNFCDPRTARYDTRYAEIARRPTAEELRRAFRYAKELGINFEALSYEKNMTGLRL